MDKAERINKVILSNHVAFGVIFKFEMERNQFLKSPIVPAECSIDP